MIKTYIAITIITTIMIGAVIYGFVIVGSPAESRGRKFDQTRVSDINNLSYSIENYYRQNKKLPEKLSDLAKSDYLSNRTKDPETNKDYEYLPTNQTTYQICANFATTTDKQRDDYLKYINSPGKDFNHPKGHYCFDLKIPSDVINQVNTYTPLPSPTTTAVRKTTTYKDNKIESVITSAQISQIQNSNFPFGFFSDYPDEWGLINYANESVVVTVKFKEPVKIKSISNIFTHCLMANCYKWDAVGIDKDGVTKTLVGPTTASENIESKQIVNGTTSLAEARIVVTRTGGSDNFVHWKKIKFEYN